MTDIASLFVWRRHDVVVAAITGEIDISNARSLERQIVAELDADADGLVDRPHRPQRSSTAPACTCSTRSTTACAGRLRDRAPRRQRRRDRVLDLSGPRPQRWIHATEDDAIDAVDR